MKKRNLFAAVTAIVGAIIAFNPTNAHAEELDAETSADTDAYYEETVDMESTTYTEPTTLEEASENLAQAQQAVDDVKEILDNVTTAYDEAQQAADAANTACQAAEQDNITAVVAVERAYMNAVTDAENAEKEAETDVTEAETAVQQAEDDKKVADQKVTDADAALENAQAAETAAETAVEEAQKAVDASGSDSAATIATAEKTLEDANATLESAQTEYASGIQGFLQWMQEKAETTEMTDLQKQDITDAIAWLEKGLAYTYSEDLVNGFSDSTRVSTALKERGDSMVVLGDEKDASSISNMQRAITLMKEINELRLNDDNFECSEAGTNFTMIVKSIVSCMAAAGKIDHCTKLMDLTDEALAWGYSDVWSPTHGWYYDEKEIYDENPGDKSTATGHYRSLMDMWLYNGKTDYASVNGVSDNGNYTTSNATEDKVLIACARTQYSRTDEYTAAPLHYVENYHSTEHAYYTIDEYEALLNEYIAYIDLDGKKAAVTEAENALAAAKMTADEKTEALEQAKAVLAEKKEAVTAAETALANAKTDAEASDEALTAAENKLDDAKAALAKAEDKLERAKALDLETAYDTPVTDPDFAYLNDLVNIALESKEAASNAQAAKEYADMCLTAKETLYKEETAAYAVVLADLARAQEDYNKFDTDYKERQAAALITTLNGVDYSAVYNFEYFQTKYPDVKAAFGNDGLATLKNFVRWGMESGRQGCESFDVNSYKNGYQDLRLAFGNDLRKYYEHYINYGKKEGRKYTTNISTVLNPVTSLDGVDYSKVYDYDYYIEEYADIKDAFGTDDISTLKHFVQWGMGEHRQGCESFDVLSYKNAYQDLRLAFGNDYKSYYTHYLNYGYKEGRKLTTDVTEVRNPVTVLNGVDYSAVYDFKYFQTKYPDVRAAFGDDDIATLQNFIRWGIPAGRQGIKDFDVNIYKQNYPSLVNTYGSDLLGYYLHYIRWGKKAGLVADRLI